MNNQVEIKNCKECLDIIIEQYLESNPMMRSDGLTNEIEMRFGNDHKISKISKIDYDNVAQTLCNHGFKFKENFHSLRIFHEFKDVNTGKIRDSIYVQKLLVAMPLNNIVKQIA